MFDKLKKISHVYQYEFFLYQNHYKIKYVGEKIFCYTGQSTTNTKT